jgi:GGDEF domain-containing protein
MAAIEATRRALVVARPHAQAQLVPLAAHAGWTAVDADGFGHARFLLALSEFDAAVVADDLAGPELLDGLAWLAANVDAPPVLVAAESDEAVPAALRLGVLWAPTQAVFRSPSLLGALLDRADEMGRQRRAGAQAVSVLRDRESRVERLRTMLWESAPAGGPARWLTQRNVLERLEEEVARCRRGGAPLAVVLGELDVPEGLAAGEADRLAGRMTEALAGGKRRSDVAGHYGRRGFLMLMPQTTSEQAFEACRRLRLVLADPAHGPGEVCARLALAEAGSTATVAGVLRRAEERLQMARERGADVVAE